ncbi:hypothetical protein PIB30_108453, partial [Stylosanthes scabra]|nr:hypothetical protein [Stylosanthes scabra]
PSLLQFTFVLAFRVSAFPLSRINHHRLWPLRHRRRLRRRRFRRSLPRSCYTFSLPSIPPSLPPLLSPHSPRSDPSILFSPRSISSLASPWTFSLASDAAPSSLPPCSQAATSSDNYYLDDDDED